MKLTLRPYQVKAREDVREAFRAGAQGVCLTLPTGAGKTVIFCDIAERTTARARKSWILVHRQELLAQTSRKLDEIGVSHGCIAPGFTPLKAPVQVCSVATLVRRLEKGTVEDVDLIIMDECHHSAAGTWRKILESRPKAKLLGVTATPVRTDGQPLGRKSGGQYDLLVKGPSTRELIAAGWLSPVRLLGPPEQVDLEGVKKQCGDFAKGELAARMDKPTITGDAVAHYKKWAHRKPALAFCASVAHAQHVAEQFRAAGYVAASVDGAMDSNVRKKLIEDLGAGRINVLTSCDIVSEGTDVPVVQVGILLRPTMSLALYLQQVGRVLRVAPGKEYALILDHVGNWRRHGLPDADRDWTLDGPRKTKGKKKDDDEPALRMRQCPTCYACHAPEPACPHCGHVYEGRKVRHVEGVLSEVTEEQAEFLRRRTREAEADEVRSARTMQELLVIERARGYKTGWANYVYQARVRRWAAGKGAR